MKKLYTIFLSIIIVLSVMGQSVKKMHLEVKRVNQHKKIIASNTSKNHIITKKQIRTSFINSTLDKKQRLDSTITTVVSENTRVLINIEKFEFVYDAFGSTTMETQYYWYPEQSKWIPNARFEYSYNSLGYVTSELEYEWDEYTNTYAAYWKTEYTNNLNGNPTIMIYSYREEVTSEWAEYSKTEYSYNNNENLTLAVAYDWDNDISQWLPKVKSEFIFNSNQNLSTNIFSEWVIASNQWKNVTKDEYTYDINDNEILLIHYQWAMDGSNVWIEYSKHENTFDENGNLLIHTSYDWNFITSFWEANLETEFVYNANNEIITAIYRNWDTNINQWNNTSKLEYIYDENGNPLIESYSTWDQNSGEWTYSAKGEYSFNYNYDISELLLPDTWMFTQDYPEEVMNMLTSINRFAFIDSNWLSTSQTTYYYSEIGVGIIENDGKDVVVFPIPANDFIIFNIGNNTKLFTVEIYDIQGKTVLRKVVNNDEQVLVKHLNSGVYMYELSTKDDIYRGKIMIK